MMFLIIRESGGCVPRSGLYNDFFFDIDLVT